MPQIEGEERGGVALTDRHALGRSNREVRKDALIGDRIFARVLANRVRPLAEFLAGRWILALA
jgi:hypothetical protein